MGNKFASYAAAALVPGKTVELRLNMLPGSPVVHVEHLGETNVGYTNDTVAGAGMGVAAAGNRKRTPKERKELRDKRRKTLAAHAIRKLDAKHDDGTAATNADIPEWLDAVPDDVVDTMFFFALDADNFREVTFASVAAVAEK